MHNYASRCINNRNVVNISPIFDRSDSSGKICNVCRGSWLLVNDGTEAQGANQAGLRTLGISVVEGLVRAIGQCGSVLGTC